MSRTRPVLLILAVAVALPVGRTAVASAAPAAEPVEPVLVAGPPEPTGGGVAEDAPLPTAVPARLYVGQRRRTVCVSFDRYDAQPEEELDEDGGFSGGGPDATCGGLPREDEREPFVLRIGGDGDAAERPWPEPAPPDGSADVGGAVRDGVAAIELVGPGGRTVRLATSAPPPTLAGTAAGELRYFLGRGPADVRSWRLLDAAGAVVHEGEGNVFRAAAGRLVRGPVRLAAGGRGKGGWRLSAEIRSLLSPLPGQPLRRVRSLCYGVVRGDADGSADPEPTCLPLPLDEPFLAPRTGCRGAGPNLVAGLEGEAAGPRAVTTTDGRRIRLRRFALPAAFGAGDAHVVLAVAPDGSGIRAGYGGPDLPPTRLNACDFGGAISLYGQSVAGQPPLGGDTLVRPAGPSGPRVFVRELGEKLCVAVERPVRAGDCTEPTPLLGEAYVRPVAGGRMIAGTVDGRIARVRLKLSSGATVEVPTVRDRGYAGRYAPYVAFVGYVAPPGATVEAVWPIGPRGSVLSSVLSTLPRLRGPARRLGAVEIRGVRRTVASAPWFGRSACVFFVNGEGLPAAGDRCPLPRAVGPDLTLDVPCGKPLVVGGQIPGPGGRLEAVLASGRRIAAPIVPIDRRSGVAFLTVPRESALRRVEVRSRGGRVLSRSSVPAPPTADHCGYGTRL